MKTLLLFLLLFSSLCAKQVVVIGGGPAGLATAIEARLSGAEVTVVEKRSAYTRRPRIFLINSSLELLKKWQISLPKMQSTLLPNGDSVGFVEIKHLEEQLAHKAKELGVQRLEATFKNFDGESKVILLTPQKNEVHLAYDILVGADGAHSQVREALPIELKQMGHAQGSVCLVPLPKGLVSEVSVSGELKRDDFWIKRILTPAGSIVFIQHPIHADAQDLEKETRFQGWNREADLIAKGNAFFLDNIEILLQQAKSFSDRKKSVLLVGDAAAVASFFQGMGANSALKAAAIAGAFFKTWPKDPGAAYSRFDQSMQEMTDALIEDSRPLFIQKSCGSEVASSH